MLFVNYDVFTFEVIEHFLSLIFIIEICHIYGSHYLIVFICILYRSLI